MTVYVAAVPLVVHVGPDGTTRHAYIGQPVEYGDPAALADAIAAGYVRSAGDAEDAAAVAAAASTVADEAPLAIPRPPFTAPKSDWVDFAVAGGYARAEAEAMTKHELIELLS